MKNTTTPSIAMNNQLSPLDPDTWNVTDAEWQEVMPSKAMIVRPHNPQALVPHRSSRPTLASKRQERLSGNHSQGPQIIVGGDVHVSIDSSSRTSTETAPQGPTAAPRAEQVLIAFLGLSLVLALLSGVSASRQPIVVPPAIEKGDHGNAI